MSIDAVIPWEYPDWDRYVGKHPAATVYHTSTWCRIVAEVGRYRPRCLVAVDSGRVTGLMPVMEIRSRLTGNRLGALPFSDECFALADSSNVAAALLDAARGLVEQTGVARLEMRGAPRLRGGDDGVVDPSAHGFGAHTHFNTYTVPLSDDIDAVRSALQSKMRQMLNKSVRMGVSVQRVRARADLAECYRLYVLNRRQHGIPPQPFSLYETIAERFGDDALFYLAEYEGVNVASLVALRFGGVTVGKYEGVDPAYRRAMPIHPLLWTGIEDAARAGDRYFDLGRTAMDNAGLNEFKTRWGAVCSELPYFYHPPGAGISVVKSASLKYRVFTGVFRRLPAATTIRLGARLFRHFG